MHNELTQKISLALTIVKTIVGYHIYVNKHNLTVMYYRNTFVLPYL